MQNFSKFFQVQLALNVCIIKYDWLIAIYIFISLVRNASFFIENTVVSGKNSVISHLSLTIFHGYFPIPLELVVITEFSGRGSHPTFLAQNFNIYFTYVFLALRILTLGQPPKVKDCLLFKIPPSNPMASIFLLCAICLPLYMGIPYFLNVRAWGGTFLMP